MAIFVAILTATQLARNVPELTGVKLTTEMARGVILVANRGEMALNERAPLLDYRRGQWVTTIDRVTGASEMG